MSQSSSIQDPSGTSPSNVDNYNAGLDKTDITEENGCNSENLNSKGGNGGSPEFPGPGTSASKTGGIHPHSSKLLNKLDPRFDADRLQEAAEGRLKEDTLT